MKFTLYCFAKVFHLSYSGEPKYRNTLHLYNFFNEEIGCAALAKVVSGQISGDRWIKRMLINPEVCEAIQDELVCYVYRKIIQESTKNLKKEQLLESLLKHSLRIPKETQREIYANRDKQKIIDYINSFTQMAEMQFQSNEHFSQQNQEEHIFHVTAPDFIEENLKKSKIAEIDFMFCKGTEWLRNDHRILLLDELREKNIPCRMIINSDLEVMEEMIKHMGHLDRAYTTAFQSIQNWYQYQKKYPSFRIKISPLPLLHCYYHIKTEHAKNDMIRLHYYIYKNAYARENYAQLFNAASPYYQLYTEEFEYLWELSSDIEEYFLKNNPHKKQ